MFPILALIPTKVKLALAGIAAVGLIVGYFYVSNLQLKVKLAAEVKAKLESVIEAQKLVIDDTNKSLVRMGQINSRLTNDFNTAQKEKSDLQKKLSAARLKEMGQTDPKLLEQKVNRGTANAFRCNEIVTGSPLVASDAGNPLCPDLVKGAPVPASTPSTAAPVTSKTEKEATNLLNKLRKSTP